MRVFHMNGAGNSFAVVDVRGQSVDLSALAKTLCKRFRADGLMAVDSAQACDFRLHFYNADGSRGEMCGNGSRCVCRFAFENGIAGEQMRVETDAGLIYARRLDESNYRVLLNNPGILDANRLPDCAYIELGRPGIPHGVTELPGLRFDQKEALRARAESLRHSPAFPKGANISFFALTGADSARVLTYERFVEDYTLACGTSCASVASLLYAQGRLPGGKLTAACPGGVLHIQIEGTNGAIRRLHLEGPTEIMGIYDL